MLLLAFLLLDAGMQVMKGGNSVHAGAAATSSWVAAVGEAAMAAAGVGDGGAGEEEGEAGGDATAPTPLRRIADGDEDDALGETAGDAPRAVSRPPRGEVREPGSATTSGDGTAFVISEALLDSVDDDAPTGTTIIEGPAAALSVSLAGKRHVSMPRGQGPVISTGSGAAAEVWQRADAVLPTVQMGLDTWMRIDDRIRLAQTLMCWDRAVPLPTPPGEAAVGGAAGADVGRWVPDENHAGWSGKVAALYRNASKRPLSVSLRAGGRPGAPAAHPQTWVPPPSCPEELLPFSRDAFCRLLGGNNVLVLGDESQAGFFDVLADLLGRAPVRHGYTQDPACPGRIRPDGGCFIRSYSVCGQRTQLTYRRNDLVELRGSRVGRPSTLSAGSVAELQAAARLPPASGSGLTPEGHVLLPVGDLLHASPPERPRYDIIIISRALTAVAPARRGGKRTLLMPSWRAVKELNDTLTVLRQVDPKMLTAWGVTDVSARSDGEPSPRRARQLRPRQQRRRARGNGARPLPLIIYREPTVPGLHAGCSPNDVPLTAPPPAMLQPLSSAAGSGCGLPCEVRETNVRVRRLLSIHYPGVLLMPVASSTSLRRDAHLDPARGECELYEGVGPYDHWARLLFNTLRQLSRLNDRWDDFAAKPGAG